VPFERIKEREREKAIGALRMTTECALHTDMWPYTTLWTTSKP